MSIYQIIDIHESDAFFHSKEQFVGKCFATTKPVVFTPHRKEYPDFGDKKLGFVKFSLSAGEAYPLHPELIHMLKGTCFFAVKIKRLFK